MIHRFHILVLLLVPILAGGQVIDPRIAMTRTPLSEVDLLLMPALNNEALLQAEMERRRPGVAPRFAESMKVEVTPATHGHWEILPAGEAVWRLRILSKGARSLNLGFEQFYLPEGGNMIIYSFDRKRIMGPFLAADNEEHGQLWTPIFDGDGLVLEVRIPLKNKDHFNLLLTSVNHDFMGFGDLLSSGYCNLDVHCGSRDGWAIVDLYRDIIQSVAIYGFNGDSFCSGFLLNNSRQDCTPYFVTANHCGVKKSNAPSLVVYWNFENDNCRPHGSPLNNGPGNGRLDDFNTGAILRAGYAPSDFTLLELDDPASPSADVFFAGWTAESLFPTDTLLCIHHPSSNEKRISFSFSDAFPGLWNRDTDTVPEGNHLVVPHWDIGTTEAGSSGAPLFNRRKQVVGQLHGGLAACDNRQYDQFGWFHSSWEGGGTPETSLRPWLDADGSGILALDGKWARDCSFSLVASELKKQVCANEPATFSFMVSDHFPDSVRVSISGLPPGAQASFSSNPVAPGKYTVLTISQTGETPDGLYDMIVEANYGEIYVSQKVTLIISLQAPETPQLGFPENGAAEASILPSFTWRKQGAGTVYEIQIASDPDFQHIIEASGDLTEADFRTDPLPPVSAFFWRVRAANACGQSPWSGVYAFRTADIRCKTWVALDTPVNISSTGMPLVESAITVEESGTVADLRIPALDIDHSFVGDLKATLTAPNGIAITLFDRPGYPGGFFGCDGNDLRLSFSDDAENTASELEETCEDEPALGGAFQPTGPMAEFRGIDPRGNWILSLKDHNNQDGGKLLNWKLELCISAPKDLTIKPQAQHYETCRQTPLSFDLAIGTGFNREVALSAKGQPQDAVVSFSDNPAPPGSVVTITLGNLANAGNFPLTINATDGIDSSSNSVDIEVLPAPEQPLLQSPPDGNAGTPIPTVLTWNATADAKAFRVLLADNRNLLKPLVDQTVADTFLILPDLKDQQQYFWKTEALNRCHDATSSDIFTFRTAADVSLSLSEKNLNSCNNREPNFRIRIGEGFKYAHLGYEVSPAADFHLVFDADTSALPSGTPITATVRDLAGFAGIYTVRLTVADDLHVKTDSILLHIDPLPGLPELLMPPDGEGLGTSTPSLQWNAGEHAADYFLEIARDEEMADLVLAKTLDDTLFTVAEHLGAGHYFWRITARNDCGSVATATRSFQVQTTAIAGLLSRQIRIFPNPVHGLLTIGIEGRIPSPLIAEVFAADGRRLQRVRLSGQSGTFFIDFSDYPPGIYMLRLQRVETTTSHKIVVQ